MNHNKHTSSESPSSILKHDFTELRNRGYWFAAKRFGWGWVPITWQGWLATLIYAILLTRDILDATIFDQLSSHSVSDTFLYFAPTFLLDTTLFLLLCYGKGQHPHWNWSFKFYDK